MCELAWRPDSLALRSSRGMPAKPRLAVLLVKRLTQSLPGRHHPGGAMSQIPRSTFDTDYLPERDRYDQWRDSLGVLFGYDLDESVPADAFRACIDNSLFGHIALTRFAASAANYERNAARIAHDGVDMLVFQWAVEGPCRFELGGEVHGCAIGDLMIMDTSRPYKSWHAKQRNFTLSIPRALLLNEVPGLDDVHLKTLAADSAMANMLRSHVLAMDHNAGSFSHAAALSMVQPTVALCAAGIRAALGFASDDSAPLRLALRQRADRVITQRLNDPDLTPERVAAAVPCSRSRLYALYRDDGGVASYIRQMRLKAVLQDLVSPRHRLRTIAAIADKWGFDKAPGFNRAFKQAFGFTPGEARSHAFDAVAWRQGADASVNQNTPRAYESWIRGVLSSR